MQTTLPTISERPTLQISTKRLALQDALVEFFAHSSGSSEILRLLSTKRKPLCYKALIDEIRFGAKQRDNCHDLPASALRAALCMIQAAGLVRLTPHGFSITAVGRKVQRRLETLTHN